jgi:hypothetical protein
MNATTNRAPHDPGSAPAVGRSTAEPGLGGDLLRGADAIAEFLFGDRRQRRRVYYLTGEARVRLPHFRLGAIICARKSTLLRWIEAHETRGISASDV